MIGFSFTFLWLTFCLVRRKVSLVAVICGFLPPYRTRVPSFSHPPLPRGAHLMRFTIITFRLQVLRQGGVTVCVGVCGHLNCNLRRQSGVSSVALVRGPTADFPTPSQHPIPHSNRGTLRTSKGDESRCRVAHTHAVVLKVVNVGCVGEGHTEVAGLPIAVDAMEPLDHV